MYQQKLKRAINRNVKIKLYQAVITAAPFTILRKVELMNIIRDNYFWIIIV